MNLDYVGNYFNNDFQPSQTSGLNRVEIFLKKHSPANLEQVVFNVPIDFEQIDDCLESLNQGEDNQLNTKFYQRIELIKAFTQKLQTSTNDIASILALETGRPIWDCKEELNAAIYNLEFSIKYTSEFVNNFLQEARSDYYFKPIGQTLIIGSFSDPVAFVLEQMSYLFLAGNAVLIKPSHEVILTFQHIFKLLHQIDLPLGSVNLLNGDYEMSNRILQKKVIKNIFFAGTTDHGKEITKQLGSDLYTKLNLQLSTKNCCIIDNNKDFNSFVPSLIKSAYQATGQFSTRTALVFAHDDIIDELIEQTHSIAKKIIIAPPLDSTITPFMGPLISQTSLDNYLQYMGMALREGGEEIMRGKRLEELNGYYVTPSIHRFSITEQMGHFIKSEQLFPNITFISYKKITDAINKINDLPFGLACSSFLQNPQDEKECIKHLQVGIFLKNSFLDHHSRHYRFGGDKDSSNFSNVGTAMFEAGLKRVTLRSNKNLRPNSSLIGIATKDIK